MPKRTKSTVVDPDALYASAQEMVQAGNPTPALTAINKALKARPKWPEAFFVRGLVRLQQGEFWKAEQGEFWKAADDFIKARSLKPDYTDAALKLGQSYLMTESYVLAERTFSTVLNHEPIADAYLGRGLARVGLQNFKAAEDDLNEAIRLKPDFAEAWYARGDFHKLHHHPEQAIQDFTEAIRLNPSAVGFYIERARTYLALKDYDRALADYDRLTTLAPAEFLYLERGDVYHDKGDFQAAAQEYQQYIDLGGEEQGPWAERNKAHPSGGWPASSSSYGCGRPARLASIGADAGSRWHQPRTRGVCNLSLSSLGSHPHRGNLCSAMLFLPDC